MAKDDYFVLVYKLLRYLYRCLKQGIPVDWNLVSPSSRDFPVNQEYFTYLLSHLLEDGYIEGIAEVQKVGRSVQFKETDGLRITPAGIAYLQENSIMKKVEKALGPAGEIADLLISNLK